MKRVGYITDKDGRRITLLEAMGDYGNIQKAYNKARKCKRHRKDVLIFTKDKEENLDKVREDIINLAYEPSKYHYFNTYNNKLGKTDAEYTAAVDNGSYGNFVKDSAGYGLAQWTYWSRKQALLNHAKQAGASIADLNMQLGFLWEELQGYTAVMDALKKAGSVRAASDAVLTGYEKPADQSETVKKKRAEYGEGYYKKYAAGNGTKYYRVRKSWTDAASQLGAFTSLENAKSACKAGYTVYDDNGKAVYTAAGQQASAGVPFSVQVDILDLNIRTGAGTNYAKTGETTGKGVFTIVEVKAGQGASVGWGRLKSGAGWISLDYATRLA